MTKVSDCLHPAIVYIGPASVGCLDCGLVMTAEPDPGPGKKAIVVQQGPDVPHPGESWQWDGYEVKR